MPASNAMNRPRRPGESTACSSISQMKTSARGTCSDAKPAIGWLVIDARNMMQHDAGDERDDEAEHRWAVVTGDVRDRERGRVADEHDDPQDRPADPLLERGARGDDQGERGPRSGSPRSPRPARAVRVTPSSRTRTYRISLPDGSGPGTGAPGNGAGQAAADFEGRADGAVARAAGFDGGEVDERSRRRARRSRARRRATRRLRHRPRGSRPGRAGPRRRAAAGRCGPSSSRDHHGAGARRSRASARGGSGRRPRTRARRG